MMGRANVVKGFVKCKGNLSVLSALTHGKCAKHI